MSFRDLFSESSDDYAQGLIDEVQWICPICGEATNSELGRHATSEFERLHYEMYSPKCYEIMLLARQLAGISGEGHHYQCPECSFQPWGLSAFQAHVSSHTKDPEATSPKVACPFGCELEDNASNILTHILAKHVSQNGSNVTNTTQSQAERILDLITASVESISFTELRVSYLNAIGKPISDTSLNRAIKKLLTEGKITKTENGYVIA